MDVPQFIRHRGRVLVQDLLKWTPPRGKNPGSEGWVSMKQRGEKMVERDGKKIFIALNDVDIVKNAKASPKDKGVLGQIYRLLKARMYPELERLFFKIGIKFSGIIGNASEDLWNKAVRAGTRGRPRRGMRWAVIEKGSIAPLIAKRKQDVGKLKAGWGAGARWLGVPSREWPAWVQRHGAGGSFEDRTGSTDRPTIRLYNDDKAVKDMNQVEIVDAAIAVNERKMVIEAQKVTEHELRKIQRASKFK